MDMTKALKKFGEMLGEHLAESICEATAKHAEDFLHALPEFLGGDKEKKELLDTLEDVSQDIAAAAVKHYLKVDIKKYLD